MPIVTERLARGIYISNWSGNVTMEEVYLGSDRELELMREDELDVYVLIVTAPDIIRFPMNLSGMVSAFPDEAITTLCVDIPRMGEVLAKMVARFTPNPIEFFNNREEALARARAILADFQKQNN